MLLKQLRQGLARALFRQMLQQIVALAGVAEGRARGKEHGHGAAVPIGQAGAVAENVAGGDFFKVCLLGPGDASQLGGHRLIQRQETLVR